MAAVLGLVAVMGLLGWILGVASQAFTAVEVAAIVLILALAMRMDPGRYRGSGLAIGDDGRAGGGAVGGASYGTPTDTTGCD